MNTFSKKVATLFGFPIYVDLTFLLLAALFVFPQFGNTFTDHFAALMRLPILLVSITLHELGHAVAIRRYGHGKSKIILWGMGGVCVNRGGTYSNRNGLKIALAGPVFGLMLGLPALGAYLALGGLESRSEVTALSLEILSFTVFVNVGWSLLNLLPIFPLDGGRILMYALRIWGKKNKDRSVRLTGLIGVVFIVPLGLLCLFSGQFWTLLVVFFIGFGSWQAWKGGTMAVQV